MCWPVVPATRVKVKLVGAQNEGESWSICGSSWSSSPNDDDNDDDGGDDSGDEVDVFVFLPMMILTTMW